MNRTAIVAALGFLLPLQSIAAAQAKNVLLITADDLGVQTGCYGDPHARTPHIDALAKSGCQFEYAYVAQASCSPSRSAMFTGLYPHSNGQYGLLNANVGFQLTPEAQSQTIPALLKQAGYRTGIVGKLHVGTESEFPFDARYRLDTRDVRRVAEVAEEFFVAGAEPFFFMANYTDPHAQGRHPDFPQQAFPTQVKGIPENPIERVPPLPFQALPHPRQIERTTQYYNAASRFDAGLGMLLEALQRSGKADDTLILFIGDHGPPFFRGKTTCYEAGVRVPLLMVWPEVTQPGTRSTSLVSAVDLLPTILDAAAEELPARLHGRSLRGAIDDSRQPFREYVATEFHYHGARPFFPRRAIRDSRFKLIHNLHAGVTSPPTSIDGDPAYTLLDETEQTPSAAVAALRRAADPPEYELYDLQADPWEFANLAEDPAHAETLRRLQAALMAWRVETDDPLLTEEGTARVAAYQHVQPKSP